MLVSGGQIQSELREALLEGQSLSSSETESVVRQAVQASAAGVPRALIFMRLREGVVKQATASQMIEALKSIQQAHQDANSLLNEVAQGRRRRRRQPEAERFLETLVRALESGVPRESFEGLFAGEIGPRGLGTQRMQAIVETGEMLHLAGMDPNFVRQFMLESSDRRVRRMEALRAARLAVILHSQGKEPNAIFMRVWNRRIDRPN